MKNQAIQYVAIDVHQATLVVSVRDEQGTMVMRATVATEAKAIVGLARGLAGRAAYTRDVRRHGRLGSAIVRVGVRNLRGMAKGEQDARRGSVFDL